MKSGNRRALMAGLALVMSVCLSAPSSAQKGEVAALSARIAELSRAGRYAEATPLAQGQLESLEKKYGPFNSDVAGALTALPFHLLVTEPPPAAIPETFAGYRDAAWLLKRQAVSILPSAASPKALRAFARNNHSIKPMTGFGDPLFNPMQDGGGDDRAAGTIKSASRALVTSAYTDFWRGVGVDRARLAQALPQLPDTADELKGVASDLGVAASDIHLGADASETTVKRAPLADYGIVYFATHGLVAGDVKGVAEPSLALSIPKQPSDLDDGLLTSSEVAQLKLNADWVVLSAPAPARCWSRTGRSIPKPRPGSPSRPSTVSSPIRRSPRRGAAAGDARLSQRHLIAKKRLSRLLGAVCSDRRGSGALVG